MHAVVEDGKMQVKLHVEVKDTCLMVKARMLMSIHVDLGHYGTSYPASSYM